MDQSNDQSNARGRRGDDQFGTSLPGHRILTVHTSHHVTPPAPSDTRVKRQVATWIAVYVAAVSAMLTPLRLGQMWLNIAFVFIALCVIPLGIITRASKLHDETPRRRLILLGAVLLGIGLALCLFRFEAGSPFWPGGYPDVV